MPRLRGIRQNEAGQHAHPGSLAPSNLAKRIRASPFLLNLPRRSSGAAPARHPTERSRAKSPAPPDLLARRICRNEAGKHPPAPRLTKRASECQRRAFALSDFAIGLVAIEIGGICVRLRQGNGGCSSSRPAVGSTCPAAPTGGVVLLRGDGWESVCVHGCPFCFGGLLKGGEPFAPHCR